MDIHRQQPGAALIELHQCSLLLDDQPVLDRVNFRLGRGERWALIGANGSGKTMVLRLLRGELWPTPTDAGHERRDAELEREQIVYLGAQRQDKYIRHDWDLSVEQVVTTGLFDEDLPLTEPSRSQRERVARMLRRFQLWSLRDRSFLSLSYGQRRMVLVARAFASPARVLLLDEVFNGLADKAKAQLKRALEAPRGGHEWVITTHRPKELPKNVTHVARIEAGRIVESGPVAAMAHLLTMRSGHPRREKAGSSLQPQGDADRMARDAGAAPLVQIRSATLYRDYRRVIRDLNWNLHAGESWAVLGGNGSGKSTLLSLIYGDLHPALGGSIERRGAPFGTHIEAWKQRVGWVSPELQADYFDAQSLEEIVISGRYSSIGLNESPTASDRRAARRWMKFFGIDALRERGPRQVSYGQMRLALFARAMMNEPQLLLLDEPCTGLDADTRATVLAFIEQLVQRGTQLVMAVHDPEDIVAGVQQILRIKRGGQCEMLAVNRSERVLAE